MLINKALDQEGKPIAVTIKYNGKEHTLQPGEKFDVRDFDVPNAGVINTEKHIMKKNPGMLDIASSKADAKENEEYRKEIKAINSMLHNANEKIRELQGVNEALVQKHAAMAGEVETAKQEAQSLRKDQARIIKENKDLEEEVEKLRLRTTGKGK